jgi:hypothetical protein
VLRETVDRLLEDIPPIPLVTKLPLDFPASKIIPKSRFCPPQLLECHNKVFHHRFKGCYIIISLVFVFVVLSLVVGVCLTETGKSVGDAFTLSSWVLAIGTIVASAFESYHYPHCTCWKHVSSDMKDRKDIEMQLWRD